MAGGTLGDHAFQMKLLDLFEESFAVTHDVFGEFDETGRLQNVFEHVFALDYRAKLSVIAVDVRKIEE